jgi:nitroimidazol reductase NimA-like FMN-containing flavoprotein (pyridoxamine 5'-phosphate oxidase superfamily)
MRRKEREIQDRATLEAVLGETQVIRIALCSGNEPYIVPMNFAYQDNLIYLHSATEGKKIEMMKENPNVCFETENKTELRKDETPCNWEMRYISVIGRGKAVFIDDQEEKIRALNAIVKKYAGTAPDAPTVGAEYSPASLSAVQAIKIEIKEMTGKKA